MGIFEIPDNFGSEVNDSTPSPTPSVLLIDGPPLKGGARLRDTLAFRG